MRLLALACRAVAAATLLLVGLAPVSAYEADVHYGLTYWLALKAGYDTSQAHAIAVANSRVDGGLMDTTELALENACVTGLAEAARLVQQRHAPAAVAIPAPAEARVVEPGGPAAKLQVDALVGKLAGKESFMLGRFGEALHPLQDSWSHAGVPGTASPAGLACDPKLSTGHPTTKGGPHSHAADQTYRWPTDVLAMARSTYDALLAYPAIQQRQRTAATWQSLIEPIQKFSAAKTKTEKRAWFLSQGIPDTSFLEGLSLPDGPAPGPLDWSGRKLPPLPDGVSRQHDVPADARAFIDRFLANWLGAMPTDRLVAEFGAAHAGKSARQLSTRLALWKVRDHGAVADLAHAPAPLNATQLSAADQIVRKPGVFVRPTSLADAFLPLQAKGTYASPLLPYITRALPAAKSGDARVIAIARLRHAPYDSVGWIVEKTIDGRWTLIDMVSLVDD